MYSFVGCSNINSVVQLSAMQAVGGDMNKLYLIDDETAQLTFDTAWSCNLSEDVTDSNKSRQWRFGERLFRAQTRMLDQMGLKTGLSHL